MGDASRREGLSGKVQTVLGPVDAYEIGMTLPHEHMFTQMSHVAKEPAEAERKAAFYAPVTIEVLGSIRYGSAIVLDNCRLDDVDTAIAEVSLFREAGGGTIVDVTSIGIGRNPEGLVRIARASGVNIVMGSSYYVEENYPSERGVKDKTEDEIADEILGDIFEGVDGTDVRAGVIGEVGCSWPLTATERKVLRASGLAQRRSGAALTIHPGRNSAAPLEIVEVLRDAGADLGRTILGHLDRTIDDPGSLKKLAAAGCILEFDLFGNEGSYAIVPLPVDMPNDNERLRRLQWLIAEGHGKSILISHDIAFKQQWVRYGGHGYAHILANVVPLMRRKGFREEDINAILVDNPRRLLAFE